LLSATVCSSQPTEVGQKTGGKYPSSTSLASTLAHALKPTFSAGGEAHKGAPALFSMLSSQLYVLFLMGHVFSR
jgi:hypothetical protein